MDIGRYLSEILSIDSKIANKMYEVEMWKDIAEGSTGSSDGERVQSSGSQQKMANAVARYTDLEKEIKELQKTKALFVKRIEQLKEIHYQIMHDLYIKKMSLKEMHRSRGESYTWATSTHSRAKKCLREVIENERQKE